MHRPDPDRGVFTAVCHDCDVRTRCRLYMVHNRYWWMCPHCTVERDQAKRAGQERPYEVTLDEMERGGH